MRRGPIFSQLVLADEINRSGPRTQSALLEAMEERQVTVDIETVPLPRPFMVLATQNPVELEGTFPLPEAQLDRFLVKLNLGYPTEEDERAILNRFKEESPLVEMESVATAEEIIKAQQAVRRVHVSPAVEGYLVNIIRATRENENIELGASPRATLALYRTVQASAAANGRAFALPDDVKRMAASVLAHRIILSTRTRLRGRNNAAILSEVISGVPVPVETAA
jgi:MoxR-like ATPase